MDTQTLTPDQIELLKNRIIRSAVQLKNETIGMALVGTLVCIIGGFYTVSMIIKPLRKLVRFAEERGTTELPEIKSNTEIKQLATAIAQLTENLKQTRPLEKEQPQKTSLVIKKHLVSKIVEIPCPPFQLIVEKKISFLGMPTSSNN